MTAAIVIHSDAPEVKITTRKTTVNITHKTQKIIVTANRPSVSVLGMARNEYAVAGIPEAPIDGARYNRKNGAWDIAETFVNAVDSVNGQTRIVDLGYADVGAAPAIHAAQHRLTGTDPNTTNPWHGVVSRATVAPLPTSITTTTFTLFTAITPLQYYYKGELVTVNTNRSVIITATAGKYFIFFASNTGVLSMGTAFPNQFENVLVATVMWNGTDLGLVGDERHNHTRDIDTHILVHEGIGTRYISGLTFSFSGTTNANTTFNITAGQVNDEDIKFVSDAFTSGRIFYQTAASYYSFLNSLSAKPYWGGATAGSGISAVNAADYTQLTITNPARYFNYFVYASTDVLNPIYILAETTAVTAGHTSAANARLVSPPQIGVTNLTTELKLLYRIIVSGTGAIQTPVAADDYRSGGSIPGGGTNTPQHDTTSPQIAAAGVAFGHVALPAVATGTYLKDDGTWAATKSSFPFYTAAGVSDDISLISGTLLPFFDAIGAAKNIPLTA